MSKKERLKKIISVVVIIVGAFVVISGVAPMIVGAILEARMEAQIANSVGIIGGADGPTAVMVVGAWGMGSVIAKILIGVLLVAVGIWGYRKSKR